MLLNRRRFPRKKNGKKIRVWKQSRFWVEIMSVLQTRKQKTQRTDNPTGFSFVFFFWIFASISIQNLFLLSFDFSLGLAYIRKRQGYDMGIVLIRIQWLLSCFEEGLGLFFARAMRCCMVLLPVLFTCLHFWFLRNVMNDLGRNRFWLYRNKHFRVEMSWLVIMYWLSNMNLSVVKSFIRRTKAVSMITALN